MNHDSHIAKAILHHRNQNTQTVQIGLMREALGATGFATAITNRWLVPDAETGMLHITSEQSRINDLRRLAEMAPALAVGQRAVVADNGDSYDGVISKVNPDGTYSLSFGDRKPRTLRAYRTDELNTGDPADSTAANPASPASPAIPAIPTVQGQRTISASPVLP